jgi:hypothetical protein
MARYNPELMMVDGGGDTVFAPAGPKVDTRIALRKLQSGQPLTDDEKRSLGLPVAAPTVTDTTVTDTTTTDAAAKAAADAKAEADAKALADAAAAKAAADAAAAAAKTAAEIAAAKAAQLAAEKALADAKAAADKAAADKAAQAKAIADAKAAEDREKRQSAYDLLYNEFERYGLASLVTPLKDLITSGVSPSEFTLRLRETPAYQNRFAANQARIKNGLRALSESEYIRNEDLYQEVMRRRGLPTSYYEQTVDPVTGITKQKGFEALLAGDVSSTELEDRIVTAQDRVLNANPEIAAQLKQFYPGISNGDILAYALDPANAINAIKRKITAAEIGVAAKAEGLTSGLSRAEELAMSGITGEAARQGYRTVAELAPRGSQLAEIYKENPYTQTTAETEVFGLSGATEARKQRQKITGLEKATFGGQTGITSSALTRDRAGGY